MKHPNVKCAIGPLGGPKNRKVEAVHYAPPKPSFAPNTRICNASSRDPYIPQDKTAYREGSQVRHPSKGLGC